MGQALMKILKLMKKLKKSNGTRCRIHKKNFKMQLPVKAKVTSSYGKREEDKIVSADHYGIDLGVVIGTTVVAAMEGKVTLVSNEGEYGTHVKIVNKDITTIYAHCSKILVKKVQKLKKDKK